jgi:tRNA-dihydrouridine synthase A
MIGRAAYQQPFQFGLWAAMIYGLPAPDANDMMARMADYADVEVANGERVIAITRHMLGFANGQKGARRWRRMLSEDARAATANGDLIRNAWEILMTARKDAA